jgi:hypothetical protein
MDMHNPEIVKIDRRIFGILAEYLAIDSLVAIPSLSAYSSGFDFGPRKWDTMPCNEGKVRNEIKPNPATPATRDLKSDSSILVVLFCPVLSYNRPGEWWELFILESDFETFGKV